MNAQTIPHGSFRERWSQATFLPQTIDLAPFSPRKVPHPHTSATRRRIRKIELSQPPDAVLNKIFDDNAKHY